MAAKTTSGSSLTQPKNFSVNDVHKISAGRVACCPWWVTVIIPMGQRDRRTPGRYVTLFTMGVASITRSSTTAEGPRDALCY